MARYYFERSPLRLKDDFGMPRGDVGWAVFDRDTNERIGTLHDVVLAERVVDLLNDYEEKFDGR